MKTLLVILSVVLIGVFVNTSSRAAALVSTLDDQQSVEVTVYNSNLGLVKDTRRLNLSQGRGELRFMDVASSIMPYTVKVQGSDALTILEQNYEYDLMDSNKLLDKYVGKNVKLQNTHEFQDRKEVVDAVLLSNNSGQIYKINNEIHLGAPGYVVLPEIPENLVSKPTLTWKYDNPKSQSQTVQVSYLTDNINWKADYVLSVNEDDTVGDLSGWVTLDNTSGATYKDAKLKLIAGQVNRVQQYPGRMFDKAQNARMELAQAAPMMQEHGFFEYHIYDLPYKTTIKDKQTKQLALLQGDGARLTKEFVVNAGILENYFWYKTTETGKIKMPVEVKIKIKNSKENHLGMPLPQGTVRIYKQDHDKSQQFIGEDAIEHTPKDEEISLKVGEAFDVVAESRQTDFKQIDAWTFESEWEITLRNHKETPISVAVIEPVSFGLSNFDILSSTHPYKKLNTTTVRFDVPVAKDQETVLTYRVRMRRG